MRKNISRICIALNHDTNTNANASVSHRDGTIYSYNMPIARRIDGFTFVVDSEESPSRTTSTHINGVATYFYNSQCAKVVRVAELPVDKASAARLAYGVLAPWMA